MEVVTLTRWETAQAKLVGKWRTEESRKRSFSETAGFEGGRRDTKQMARFDMIGAGAEMAFAKWSGLYWSYHVNNFDGSGDVGKIEVRSSEKHHHNLLLRPHDQEAKPAAPDTPFVLVTGTFPTFRIHGWALGREVMCAKYWRDLQNGRDPCWIMPQADLTPLFLLPLRSD